MENYNGWNLPDPLGTSPIKLALREDRKEMVNFLLNSARRDATPAENLAAQKRFEDWNVPDENSGFTPLCDALRQGQSNIVETIVNLPNIDYDVKTKYGRTLAQEAVFGENVKCVEILAAQEKCECWNVPYSDGNTPVLMALKTNKMDILQTLLKCPRVDLSCRDVEGWSMVFRAIALNNKGKY